MTHPESLLELARFARETVPFYRDLYRNLPRPLVWSALPSIDPDSYWHARGCSPERFRSSAVALDGYVVRTSGTTSVSGIVEIGYKEVEEEFAFVRQTLLNDELLKPGDRVVNLMASGDMRASFILVDHILAGMPLQHIPLAVSVSDDVLGARVEQLQANAVMCFPSRLASYAYFAEENGVRHPSVERILYSGEPLASYHADVLSRVFPSARIESFIYGSVDAGTLCKRELRFKDASCFSAIEGFGCVEIVDEAGVGIQEVNRPGRILLTNLCRRLSPVIRYPVGDWGQWIEPGGFNAPFQLLGRKPRSFEIGGVDVSLEILERIAKDAGLSGVVQVELTSQGEGDCLLMRFVRGAVENPSSTEDDANVVAALQRRIAAECSLGGEVLSNLGALEIRVIREQELKRNPVSAKFAAVLDYR